MLHAFYKLFLLNKYFNSSYLISNICWWRLVFFYFISCLMLLSWCSFRCYSKSPLVYTFISRSTSLTDRCFICSFKCYLTHGFVLINLVLESVCASEPIYVHPGNIPTNSTITTTSGIDIFECNFYINVILFLNRLGLMATIFICWYSLCTLMASSVHGCGSKVMKSHFLLICLGIQYIPLCLTTVISYPDESKYV
jgi:hypothetical protein